MFLVKFFINWVLIVFFREVDLVGISVFDGDCVNINWLSKKFYIDMLVIFFILEENLMFDWLMY